ncbi:dynein axonemal assembly factor 5 [Venturia canescens]|uniref:dynein axonemal assembly factor 5 n=1 Tax=Venturia canescens TaxID=32260 RepID=UPI001C9D5F74|nr:dynein axonemal assembly factor 5 [Venturia canescens]
MSKVNNLQLSRICVSLQAEEKGRRKKALEELYACVSNNEWTTEEYLEIWDVVNKQLARSLTDDAEFCRNISIELWKKFLYNLPVDDKNIVHLMTILSRRLSPQELLETSEEVRLSCVKLLRLVIEKYAKYLSVYYDDFVAILARTVTDNYPEIKRESCQCIEELAKSIPEQFYSRSKTLVKPTLSNFNHQHWKVRAASVRAVGQIMLYGNSQSMEEVATPMAEKLFDQSGAVRTAVIEVAGLWLLELRDRYSWWHKLLPLLVTGLHDEVEAIRNRASVLWQAAGELYMKENENDEKFKDKLDFLTEDPKHYPPNVERPNLGCRTIVQQNICKLVAAISKELSDWLADIKVRSAQLLCVLVLHVEDHVIQHIEKLLPPMYRACNDEDSRVVVNVELAAEYMGYFVPPSTYCHLVIPTLDENITAGHLRVFAAILRGSESQSLRPKLCEIGKFLQQPFVCRSKKPRYQKQLARCCESIIKVGKSDCVEIAQELFTVLFTLISTCQEESSFSLAEKLLEELARLEDLAGLEELFVSHLRPIFADLKDSCQAWTIYSTELQMFRVCMTRATVATSQNTDLVLPILKTTMSNEADPELRLKLFILLSNYFQQRKVTMRHIKEKKMFVESILKDVIFAGLVWSAGRAAEAIRTAAVSCLCALFEDDPSRNEKSEPIEKKSIVETIRLDRKNDEIDPSKENNVEVDESQDDIGDTSESMKNMEIEDSNENMELFQKPQHFIDIFEKIIPVLVTLVDDNAKKTRLYALRALYLLVEIARKLSVMTDDRVNEIYSVVLKRLDDGCDDVRIAAIETLVVVWGARTKNYDVIFSASHVDFLYTSAIVHLDDPDESFQSIMLDALFELGKVHPELLLKKIENSKGNFRNQNGLEKLLNRCQTLLRESKYS